MSKFRYVFLVDGRYVLATRAADGETFRAGPVSELALTSLWP